MVAEEEKERVMGTLGSDARTEESSSLTCAMTLQWLKAR